MLKSGDRFLEEGVLVFRVEVGVLDYFFPLVDLSLKVDVRFILAQIVDFMKLRVLLRGGAERSGWLFRFVGEKLFEKSKVLESFFPAIDLLLILILKLSIFEDFPFGLVLTELEQFDGLLELLFFFLADLRLKLFLDTQSKLFAFGLTVDNIAERAFVGRLGLMGNFFVAFAVVQVGELVLDFLKLLVELLLFLL
jgi:hypothetical protein